MHRLLRIALREYFSYLKTPGFWLSLLIAPGMGALSSYAPVWADRAAPTKTVAVIDYSHAGGAVARAMTTGSTPHAIRIVAPPPEAAAATTPDQARAALQPYLTGEQKTLANGEKLSAAVILSGSADSLNIDLWTHQLNDLTLSSTVRQAGTQVVRNARLAELGLDPAKLAAIDNAKPVLHEFSPKAASGGRVTLTDKLPTLAAFAMAFLLWALVITGASILLSSVIEEKSNRVLEVLLSSASVTEVLAGKILGVAMLAGTILLLWGGAGFFALQKLASPELTSQVIDAVVGKGLIFEFAAFFVLGYLMYASIFVAIGSFCETPREAQTLVGPMMIVLTLPIVFMSTMIRHPDNPLMQPLSWFPPFTPFLMTARAASGIAWWEVAGSLAMMVATAAVVVWISGRAFRAGALSTAKFDLPAFFKGIVNAGR